LPRSHEDRHDAEYFAVLYIQPFDIIGGCFANYGQVGITQSWTLAKGRHGGKLVRHRHKEVFLEWGAASHVLYFMCCDFPDFGHKAKYAPFGMLGKPKSAVIIKGATTPALLASLSARQSGFARVANVCKSNP
jgi:hypothetical protein